MNVPYGVIGLKIIADCVSDISTQTVLRIYYKKPSSATSEYWVATLGAEDITVDGVLYEANTYMYYITQEDDIDTLEDWKIQGYVELSGGFKGFGTDSQGKQWALLRVKENL